MLQSQASIFDLYCHNVLNKILKEHSHFYAGVFTRYFFEICKDQLISGGIFTLVRSAKICTKSLFSTFQQVEDNDLAHLFKWKYHLRLKHLYYRMGQNKIFIKIMWKCRWLNLRKIFTGGCYSKRCAKSLSSNFSH